jgi:hypothetical protein
VARTWDADTSASLTRRLGKSWKELGESRELNDCPDIWELSNGDFAVVGRNATAAYAGRLPDGMRIATDERLVVIPRSVLISAKPDIPDA